MISDDNVIAMKRPDPPPALVDLPSEDLREEVVRLMGLLEEMDRGVKLMVDVIAQHDVRVRALELAVRKIERRNVPVIVNRHGEAIS